MVYLDNAATSFPKPPSVVAEVTRCLEEYCGNPGRGGHPLSMAAAEKIYECREELSALFGAPDPSHVIFTQNATAALNLAIKGLLPDGAHVIASDLEHNSVRRPLEALAADGLISFDKISIIGDGYALDGGAICKRITTAIRKNTAAVIMTACPNVCSLQLPIAEIGAFCRRRGILFIVDGAQAAGHFPIDMRSMCIDALCLPGHKGLLGPQGSGALILGEGIMPRVIFEGGSGSSSFEAEMPREIPERYEAGTLSTPAIAGLCEGVRYIRRLGLASIEKHERSLFLYARQRLGSIPKVRIYMQQYAGSVLSFNVGTLPSDRVASALGTAGICTRGGFHCNPWAHTVLGTDAHGSVRISFSPFNTPQDVDALALALGELSRK
ncbi:MAG: aminotransferase class V-fold PLP-dependent enzyme [Clostridia bacterium]|nr:aminotransferase class V-fold PLP-dependent enzyme [Clostridia bacterium]